MAKGLIRELCKLSGVVCSGIVCWGASDGLVNRIASLIDLTNQAKLNM